MNKKVCVERILYNQLPALCQKRGCDGSTTVGKHFFCFYPMSESISKLIVDYGKAYAKCMRKEQA